MNMSKAAISPDSLASTIKRAAAFPAFMARIQASPTASDNLPQKRPGFQPRDHVVIRREIRLGETHIPQGAPGIITTVRNKGRLLDVQFGSAAITLHHLDISLAPGQPLEQTGARVVAMPARRPLLARPDNAVHPNHLLGGELQLRIGGV